MKPSAIIGFVILGILWLWLAWAVLSASFTLLSILTVGISGIIVFVPLWRKYGYKGSGEDENPNNPGRGRRDKRQ